MTSLNQKIQHFYDRSTDLWLDIWGEHMHHGYYGEDGLDQKDHRKAQIDLLDASLEWGQVNGPKRILDVGCGVGGSARYLANHFGASVLGLTLSPVQVERARQLTQQAGLSERVQFRVQDMLTITANEGLFDLVWSMESAEHIPDKKVLLQRFWDVLEPGGQFLIATWCHRDLPPALAGAEQRLLDRVCQLYHLPPWISLRDYERIAGEIGFTSIKTADWSDAVAPFWKAVIQSALSWRGVKGLFYSGLSTIKGAYAMQFMVKGYKMGVIRFGLIQGRKP